MVFKNRPNMVGGEVARPAATPESDINFHIHIMHQVARPFESPGQEQSRCAGDAELPSLSRNDCNSSVLINLSEMQSTPNQLLQLTVGTLPSK